MAAKEPRALPTVEELDLAEYKLGSARSNLDSFVTTIESHTTIVSFEEGLALLDRGEQIQEREPLDLDALARIIVFATDVIEDAEVIEEYARKLLEETRVLFHEHEGELAGGKKHWDAVRAWHEQEAARSERVA